MNKRGIIILDFGSQYTKLVARRIRDMGVFTEILPYNTTAERIKSKQPYGIVLSGGPNSVYEENALQLDQGIYDLNLPLLGICYGMQRITQDLGGNVAILDHQEFGKTKVTFNSGSKIASGFNKEGSVWMTHQDYVEKLPHGFKTAAYTQNCPAAIENLDRKIFCIQFHAEVTHTTDGDRYFQNFIKECNAPTNWSMENYLEEMLTKIKATVKTDKVILGLSGGVDSSVVALLVHKAIGDQLQCVFVNNGLLRKNEVEEVEARFGRSLGLQLETVDASKLFYDALKGQTDPETKRKIIGHKFIEVFTNAKHKHKNARFLAQGTIYPDVIESSADGGVSHTIKSHHNVGGLPDDLDFELLEPLRDLFKDEVRKLGALLGLPKDLVDRHPFPGPGLGVRIIGEITEEKVKTLQDADHIFITNLRKAGWYQKTSQAFVVLLPCKSVGVSGDYRTYEWVCAIRSVNTVDFMSADVSPLPMDLLTETATEIVGKVQRINRVTYDITSKPPGTIEWE